MTEINESVRGIVCQGCSIKLTNGNKIIIAQIKIDPVTFSFFFLLIFKVKTNGTIDFINGQRGFLSKSIYNVVPKIKELIIFPNYLMHTAYPFNIEGERRSFSFNAKIIFKK